MTDYEKSATLPRVRPAGVALVCAAINLVAGQAGAQPDDAEVRRRLARIERVLSEDQPRARTWKTAWMIAYGVLTAGQATYAVLTDDEGDRADFGVGAVKSGLGFGALAILPFRPTHAASDLAELPADTPEQRRDKLAAAERLLHQSADDEELGSGWLARIAASAVNLGGAYYLWIEHERFASGWLSLASGMAVSELQLRTHPTGALDAVSSGAFGSASRVPMLTLRPGPVFVAVGSF